ncbi:MAG: beta-L-arabinofuranosidase domain-containing protein [Candidatus Cyclobacteriaceae bacterium M3_2C_046]
MYKQPVSFILLLIMILGNCESRKNIDQPAMEHYTNNKPPLVSKSYLILPLGHIKPEGWLLQQLEIMRDGLTGNLDQKYSMVVGARNGWLGGDGDGWERGPYWIDGLLPLAYILNDDSLKQKVQPWIEWSLQNQAKDGYFGPTPFENPPPPEPGLQKDRRRDWWPKMVMLKVYKQYYEATGDQRVIQLMDKYFRYQLEKLPQTPLDHWSFWANRRGGDNLMVVYWLYNITGEPYLLELAELIHHQTFPYHQVFLQNAFPNSADLSHVYPNNTGNRYPFDQSLIKKLSLNQLQAFHCVNFAQGVKEPVIYYQHDPQEKYEKAVKQALKDIQIYHGQPQGMYGGDEPLHGTDPTQGVEFCSVVELMYSLESMIPILGDVEMMDQLEKITYNALPAQANDDFTLRQYFQSANQVMITRQRRNSYEEDNHFGTDYCFGLLTGYPCCTCNMHQGWPKFTQNLWYASPKGGVAALQYAPSQVRLKVANGQEIEIKETTNYPFEEQIKFSIHCQSAVSFPFQLRIPGWCNQGRIEINGELWQEPAGNQIISIDRIWKKGDQVALTLPMETQLSRWHENAVVVARGPLVYALQIEETWQYVQNEDKYRDYYEIFPASDWNYGLLQQAIDQPDLFFSTEINDQAGKYPWNQENAPVKLITKAKLIPEWGIYNGMPGPLPHSRPQKHLADQPARDITLIPYGCTTLRITEFPVVE